MRIALSPYLSLDHSCCVFLSVDLAAQKIRTLYLWARRVPAAYCSGAQTMRLTFAVAVTALAALAACQPDSEKTNPAIATDEAKAERETAAPAAGASSFTEAQARDHATKAGYTGVGTLTQASDGTWQGPATKDGTSVTVVVDYQGNVTTQAGVAAPPSPGAPAPQGATTPGAVPSTPETH
jgi:hypothetical protein